MTLPTDIVLPLQSDLIKAGDSESLELYLRNLTETLTDMYQQIAQNVNGYINQWTPTVIGTASEGTGTYTHQTGWYVRSGIMVDLWFDVRWTAHTGTGDIAIQLPYKVANSENEPFSGCLQTSNIPYTGGRTYASINGSPDTFIGLIQQQGDSLVRIGIPMPGAGARRLIGNLRYLGQEFEN